MTKVAPRYGLSDVGLAKVCRKYNIPRPPVGYWAKLGVGKHVEQTPLPEIDDESLQEIHFFREHFFGEGATKIVAATDEKIVVQVQERLVGPHPLIAQTRDTLCSTKRADHAPAKALSIQVSQAAVPRALRIFDALIKAWEALQGRVSIEQHNNCFTTCFTLDGDSVNVVMTEETEAVEGEANRHRYWRDVQRKFTGRLVLKVSGRWGTDLRRRWADGKKQQLENVLGSFLLGVKKWLAHQRECHLDEECGARQKQQAECVRQERKRQHERLEQRRLNLEACADNWRKSGDIRRYLDALESLVESNSLRPINPDAFPEWLSWARWYADYLDPLMPTPSREEYQTVPQNQPIPDLEFTRHTKAIVESLGVPDADALSQVDRAAVKTVAGHHAWSAWSEIGLVLEGFGYDVSNRERGYF